MTSKEAPQIFICTYNILFGLNDKVFSTLKGILDSSNTGYKFLVMQEVRNKTDTTQIEKRIRETLETQDVEFFLDNKPTINNLGLATASSVKPTKVEKIKLPLNNKRFSILKGIVGDIPQFGTLISTYEIEGRVLRIVNVHLDLAGGIKQRLKQVAEIKLHLSKSKADYEIILGDFNTLGLTWLGKRKSKKEINKIVEFLDDSFSVVNNKKEFTSEIKNIFNTEIPFLFKEFFRFVRFLGFKQRMMLDWILVKNLDVEDYGILYNHIESDHYPVWAKLKFRD